MMYRDEIIAEVWRNRDAFTARHHNNFNEMLTDLQKLQKLQKRPNCKMVDRRGLTAVKTLIPGTGEILAQSQNELA